MASLAHLQAQWMADPYAARLPPVRLPDGGGLTAKRIYRGLSGGPMVPLRGAGHAARAPPLALPLLPHTLATSPLLAPHLAHVSATGGGAAVPLSRLGADLIEDCTRLDPYARPSSRDILLRLKSLAAFAERRDTALEEAL